MASWTESDLTAIESAIKSGTLRVKYSDREVTYRSLDELMRIREIIRKSLGLVSSGRKRYKTRFSKGLSDGCESD